MIAPSVIEELNSYLEKMRITHVEIDKEIFPLNKTMEVEIKISGIVPIKYETGD